MTSVGTRHVHSTQTHMQQNTHVHSTHTHVQAKHTCTQIKRSLKLFSRFSTEVSLLHSFSESFIYKMKELTSISFCLSIISIISIYLAFYLPISIFLSIYAILSMDTRFQCPSLWGPSLSNDKNAISFLI